MELCRELLNRANSDSSLEMGLLRHSKPILFPPVAARLLAFTAAIVTSLLFSKDIMGLGRGE